MNVWCGQGKGHRLLMPVTAMGIDNSNPEQENWKSQFIDVKAKNDGRWLQLLISFSYHFYFFLKKILK